MNVVLSSQRSTQVSLSSSCSCPHRYYSWGRPMGMTEVPVWSLCKENGLGRGWDRECSWPRECIPLAQQVRWGTAGSKCWALSCLAAHVLMSQPSQDVQELLWFPLSPRLGPNTAQKNSSDLFWAHRYSQCFIFTCEYFLVELEWLVANPGI